MTDSNSTLDDEVDDWDEDYDREPAWYDDGWQEVSVTPGPEDRKGDAWGGFPAGHGSYRRSNDGSPLELEPSTAGGSYEPLEES